MADDVTAPYSVTIEKVLNGEYWVNRYYVESLALSAAIAVAQDIAECERNVHPGFVILTKLSVSSTQEGDFVYETRVLNIQGGRDIGGLHILPLFCCARIDFSVQASRPSRKYLRGVLTEDDINGLVISSTALAYINTQYSTPISELNAYVDPQGSAIYGGSCNPSVAMRQLRRGSKKKVTP